MARNRKNNATSIRLVPALKALILCTLLGASSVGYVVQINKIHKLGDQIKEREVRREQLRDLAKVLSSQNAKLLSPPNIIERMKHFGIQLDLPQPNQQVWLRLPTVNNLVPFENLAWSDLSSSETIGR